MKLISVCIILGLRKQKANLRFNNYLLFALIWTMAVRHKAVSLNNNTINTKIDILTPDAVKFHAGGWTLYRHQEALPSIPVNRNAHFVKSRDGIGPKQAQYRIYCFNLTRHWRGVTQSSALRKPYTIDGDVMIRLFTCLSNLVPYYPLCSTFFWHFCRFFWHFFLLQHLSEFGGRVKFLSVLIRPMWKFNISFKFDSSQRWPRWLRTTLKKFDALYSIHVWNRTFST